MGENTGPFSLLGFITTAWRWHMVLRDVGKG